MGPDTVQTPAAPVAPAAAAPAAPAPAPAPAAEAPVATAPAAPAAPAAPPAPSIPKPDDFKWDAWDGSSYDAFAEPVRPWVEKVSGFYNKKVEALEKARKRAEDLYKASRYGQEDPRLAEYEGKVSEYETSMAEMQAKYDALQKEIQAERDENNAQYVNWFTSAYQEQITRLSEMYKGDTEAATTALYGVCEEAGLDLAEGLEVLLLGDKAVETAKALGEKKTDPDIILDYLRVKFKPADPPAAAPEKKEPPAPPKSATLVAGAQRSPAPPQVQPPPPARPDPRDTSGLLNDVTNRLMKGGYRR